LKESNQKLYIVTVQYSKEDNDPMSEMVIKIFPCSTYGTAQQFESYFRKNMSSTQLYDIGITESPIYDI
jgi:hypothetical protein